MEARFEGESGEYAGRKNLILLLTNLLQICNTLPMKCPFHKVRADLPPLTERLKKLPVDERGYPVPFFVAWPDGKPEFRMADPVKWKLCYRDRLCWVCGERLGRFMAFTIGPMCLINRTTADPPAHVECAEWSVKGCPFLSKPQMVRREDEFTEANGVEPAGLMIKRNPGVTAIYITRSYKLFPDGTGRALIKIGDPITVTWWKEGRTATRAEVDSAIETGLPFLKEQCRDQDDLTALDKYTKESLHLLPV